MHNENIELTIQGQAGVCAQSIHYLRTLDCDDVLWTEELEARYQLWADSLGVFARSNRSSADHRFRKRQDVAQIIVQLLKGLDSSLLQLRQFVLQTGDGTNAPPTVIVSDDESDSNDSVWTTPSIPRREPLNSEQLDTVQEIKISIDTSLNTLIKIAKHVRQSGIETRNFKAENFVHKDDLGTDLTAQYSNFARILVASMFPRMNPVIRERVAVSMARRRNRIAYLQHDRLKLAEQQELHRVDESEASIAPEATVIATAPSDRKPRTSEFELRQAPSIRTTTSATTFDPTQKSLSSFSVKSSSRPASVMSGVSFKWNSLRFPKPPILDGKKVFSCPYCSEICRANEASKDRWRVHVSKDLMPYICLVEGCDNSNDAFRTTEEWMFHLQKFHSSTQLICSVKDHEPLRFSDAMCFQEHMEAEHPKTFAPSQMSELIKLNQRASSQVFDICVFCDFLPEQYKNLDSMIMTHEGQRGLQKHVANHLLELALQSASWIVIEDELSNTSSARRYENASKSRCMDSANAVSVTARERKFKDTLTFEDPPRHDSAAEQYVDPEWDGVLPVFESPIDDLLLSSNSWDDQGRPLSAQWDFFYSSRHTFKHDEQADETLKAFGDKYNTRDTSTTEPNSAQSDAVESDVDDNHDLSYEPKLQELLDDQLIEWPKGGNRFFIPNNHQSRLVTVDAIRTELRRIRVKGKKLSEDDLTDAAQKIWKYAPKLLSILVCLGKSQCIHNLLLEGITDEDLPFVRCTSQELNTQGIGAGRFKLSSRRSPDRPIRSMANWSRNDIMGFAQDQWRMLAPVFKESSNRPRKVRHYDLDDNCVMPFIEDYERTDTVASGFSTVWAVRIHPAHQLLHNSNPKNRNPLIALKKLNSTDEKDFKIEVEMLKAFSNHKDKHLIRLLATYKIKNRYHLMFPHCKYNLRTYWEANPEPKFTTTNIRWFLSQCKGLAHGLMTIHDYRVSLSEGGANLPEMVNKTGRFGDSLPVHPIPVQKEEWIYGRHGDIKPENILWSDEGETDQDCGISEEIDQIGILLIADFGPMEFHGKLSRSMVPADVGATLTYAPPEIRLKINISRAYDIWSLGCVYLEFVTWLVAWFDELHRFSDVRGLTGPSGDVNDDQYYVIVEEKDCPPRAEVRDSVTEWMKDLHEKPRCSQFIHDFVDLIAEDMLVVDQSKRISCGQLNSRLMEMCCCAKDDPSYLTDLVPYHPRTRPVEASNVGNANRSGYNRKVESPSLSPTATEGDPLPKKNDIPLDLDTTTKSPKLRAARPVARPPSRGMPVRLASPSPVGLRPSSPRPISFVFTDAEQGEDGPAAT